MQPKLLWSRKRNPGILLLERETFNHKPNPHEVRMMRAHTRKYSFTVVPAPR